jgi:predicted oxidoreductase (fatty acid repression mutant protein)
MASIDVGIHPEPGRITTERFGGNERGGFSVLRLTTNGAVAVIFVSDRHILDALQRALNAIRDDFNAAEVASAAVAS